ncbi:hypothetical protein L2E82_39143 [Cichorium intybus]|uniref:Uncharacterized protein n=1 Tax=Cichorium intybus TaxID=13427 RepID=A0ACB9AGW0_CICIN|nr:hypothetical protein L2E82_39143 [Cichorium intybus]
MVAVPFLDSLNRRCQHTTIDKSYSVENFKGQHCNRALGSVVPIRRVEIGKLTQDLDFLATSGVVDLSDNSFDGPLPSSFNRPDIDIPDLSTNHLSGSLNQFLCPKIQEPRQSKVLNLANNNLPGVIPDCWMNWDSLSVLNFEKNRLSGGIPRSVGEVPSLISLNIRRNNLSGTIPTMSSQSLLIIPLHCHLP